MLNPTLLHPDPDLVPLEGPLPVSVSMHCPFLSCAEAQNPSSVEPDRPPLVRLNRFPLRGSVLRGLVLRGSVFQF